MRFGRCHTRHRVGLGPSKRAGRGGRSVAISTGHALGRAHMTAVALVAWWREATVCFVCASVKPQERTGQQQLGYGTVLVRCQAKAVPLSDGTVRYRMWQEYNVAGHIDWTKMHRGVATRVLRTTIWEETGTCTCLATRTCTCAPPPIEARACALPPVALVPSPGRPAGRGGRPCGTTPTEGHSVQMYMVLRSAGKSFRGTPHTADSHPQRIGGTVNSIFKSFRAGGKARSVMPTARSQ